MNDVLQAYALASGQTLHQVEIAVRACLASPEWNQAVMAEAGKRAAKIIDTWPKWKQEWAKNHLSRPYVEDEDRGEDFNAKW